mgnify:CR=1 FL=1
MASMMALGGAAPPVATSTGRSNLTFTASGALRQHVQHDRRAAQVGDAMALDHRIDQRRVDLAQADMGGGGRRHAPGEGPAVAVEHRQRPEIDRMAVEAEGDDVADGVQVGAAMVIDDALGIAGRAGGVVEADGLPLVGGRTPAEGRSRRWR